MINRGCQSAGPVAAAVTEAGSTAVDSPMADTYSTCRTRTLLIQQRNPSAQSGITTQLKNDNREGLLKGVAAVGRRFRNYGGNRTGKDRASQVLIREARRRTRTRQNLT